MIIKKKWPLNAILNRKENSKGGTNDFLSSQTDASYVISITNYDIENHVYLNTILVLKVNYSFLFQIHMKNVFMLIGAFLYLQRSNL